MEVSSTAHVTPASKFDWPGAAVTYWRNPGDAGAAPQFDFAQSENVASAEPLYPAPERIDEEGVQAFGYRHDVLFPIRITPREKDKPAILALSFDYAACEKLCLPVHADSRLVMPRAGRDARAADRRRLDQNPATPRRGAGLRSSPKFSPWRRRRGKSHNGCCAWRRARRAIFLSRRRPAFISMSLRPGSLEPSCSLWPSIQPNNPRYSSRSESPSPVRRLWSST